MDKKFKSSLLLIAFGVVLFAAVNNIDLVVLYAKKAISLVLPVIAGLIVAFILSVPMKGFENLIVRIFKNCKRKPSGKGLHACGLILTFLSLALVITLVCTLAIPQLIESVKSIIVTVQEKWPEWLEVLKGYDIDTASINEWFKSLDFEKLIKNLTGGAELLLGSVVDVSVSIVSGVTTVFIAVVMSLYALMSRTDLSRQSKRVIYAYMKEKQADRICYIAKKTQATFTKFLSGQCVEAVILGTLIFIAFSIFRLPYAGLIAVLTSVFAFVPYIGAFASCVVGAFLIAISEPSKTLICVIVYIVVQFIENQFIYPHVVGNSVGLSPLWTMAAALIGGQLFGVIGMIFFIPVTAVLYSLVREDIVKRNKEKNIKDIADDVT